MRYPKSKKVTKAQAATGAIHPEVAAEILAEVVENKRTKKSER